MARWLHYRAWRDDRTDPSACYYCALALLESRTPLAVWQFMRRQETCFPPGCELHADWLALHARVAGRFRDFQTADAWLARAETADPDNPWICIERSALYEFLDRYPESLAAAERALELRPWYRPGVMAKAHVLQLLDRDTEALELLAEADRHIESGPVVAMRAVLEFDLGLYAEARRSLERFAELSPLLEKEMLEWLNARRSDAAYLCGDIAEAIRFARQAGTSFYTKLAERMEKSLETPGDGRRVVLPVGFVRQHHVTCVPATLAALCRYWNVPAEHLDIADAICYDGTPNHLERHWAEQNGYVAREFTVTWESAQALLDRGLPFTLTTVEPDSAHVQAVIGYDTRRGSFLIRDPSFRSLGEVEQEGFLERYRAIGPRGMALAPAGRGDLVQELKELDLPDAALHDRLHCVQRALAEHDRPRAIEELGAMQAAAPDHRLTWYARRVLATYDGNQAEMLEATEGLLRLYPDDLLLQLSRASYLRDLARRDERLELLRHLCEREDTHPVCWQQYAQELSADARRHDEAVRLLQRAIRYRPAGAGNYYTLAHIRWDQRRFEEAVELYRFATCLEDKDEQFAQSYFLAARAMGQIEMALSFLRDRFRRFGKKAGQPARTLFWALSLLEQTSEAFAVLDEALRLRPDDGELLLYAAEVYTNYGREERGAELLEAACGRSRQTAWLRARAAQAVRHNDRAAALGCWRQVIALEPLALDAHRAIAVLLAETEGRAAALEHLRAVCERFPHNYPLRQLWLEWLRDEGPEAGEPVARALVAAHPADAWARRELALVLAWQGKLDEAFAEMETARALEPANPATYAVYGQVYEQAGRIADARDAYRRCIELSVDNDFAIRRLLALCDTRAECRDALDFVAKELIRQVIFGDGLLAYREHAQGTLEPDELLARLREAWEARLDLWHTWSALVRQLAEMDCTDEALALAQQATARFPLLPRLWLDLATVWRVRGDGDREIDALREALKINPLWGWAARELASALTRQGHFEEARRVLEQAIARSPLDPLNHGHLADVLWKLSEEDKLLKEAALERLRRALQLEPAYTWAWDALADWSAKLGRPGLAIEMARELIARRGGEAQSCLMLARVLSRPEDLEERLAALDKAVALNPRLGEAHDLRAELLAGAGRFDEALAACRPAAWGEPPLFLRGRAAWVEARRGNLDEAIRQMRALVEEDPGYYWGWRQLADWYYDRADKDGYLEVAQGLARCAPQDPVAFGHLGEAKRLHGDHAAAKAAFRRAFELAPDYAFAGLSLFDEQLADGEYGEAARTLRILQTHVGDEFVLAREVQLAARLGDRATATRGLRELCRAQTKETWPLEAAAQAAADAGWARLAEQILREALTDPAANPEVGAVWIRQLIASGRWPGGRTLAALQTRGEMGVRAALAYIDLLARGNHRLRFWWYFRRNSDYLRSDGRLWGQVSFALTSFLNHGRAVRWLSDWRQRDDVEPWMLMNLALALRARGREAEADKVHRQALTLPADYATPYHETWIAAEDLLAGDVKGAKERLASLGHDRLDDTHRYIHALASAVLALEESANPRAAFAEARRALKRARQFPIMAADRAAVRRLYRRCVYRIARLVDGWPAKLWAYFAPWLPRALPPLPASPGT